MKLLISAYACAPNRGSEHGSAWNWTSEAARLGEDVTVLVSPAHRDAILAAFHDLGFRTRDGSPETLLLLADLFLGNSVRRNRAYADRDLIEEFSDQLPRAIRANPIVEVPADVLLVNRVMGLLSGLGKTLDSRVDLFAILMPYASELMAAQGEAAIK